MYDLKIINGKIIDSEKMIFIFGDIGIKDGKIISIGICNLDSKITIDAKGNIISPGFIDIHMHEEVIGKSDNDDFDIANNMLKMGVTTCLAGNCGENRQSVDTFFDFIDKNGAPVNYLSAIGHTYLRQLVGINDRYKSASEDEIKKMKVLIKKAIKTGIIGISFGIEYSPGIEFNEIIQVCEPFIGGDFLLSAHYRKDAKFGIQSIKELIEASRITKLPMQISHLGSATAYGMMDESLAVIQEAIDEGIDIMADCYPYNAFSTKIGTAVFDDGCLELWNKNYNDILLTEEPYKNIRCNKVIFKDARKNHPNILAIAFVMNEYEVVKAIKAPFVIIASDGLYNMGNGHPRGAGTFPRVLGKYVRNDKSLSLIEAINKMTLMPAKRIALTKKGKIKLGYDADLVIFNHETIIDKATFESSKLPPDGIEYVIINGRIAVEHNIIKENRLGKIIRRNDR